MNRDLKEFRVLWEDSVTHKTYDWTVSDWSAEDVKKRFSACHAGVKIVSIEEAG